MEQLISSDNQYLHTNINNIDRFKKVKNCMKLNFFIRKNSLFIVKQILSLTLKVSKVFFNKLYFQNQITIFTLNMFDTKMAKIMRFKVLHDFFF